MQGFKAACALREQLVTTSSRRRPLRIAGCGSGEAGGTGKSYLPVYIAPNGKTYYHIHAIELRCEASGRGCLLLTAIPSQIHRISSDLRS